MRSLLYVVVFTALAGICVGVPARDVQDSLGRIRRSINPFDFFNQNKNTKKKTKKNTKPKPKPTTQATTTVVPSTVPTDKNNMPEHIAEKLGKLNTDAEVKRFLGITTSMSQSIELAKKTLLGANRNISGQNSGSADSNAWITSTECMPRPQPIRYPQHALYRGVIWPFCGMTSRCGGCCYVDVHHCVPDQVVHKSHSVYFVSYDSVSGVPEPKSISVEYHTSCKCQCKLTPQHCDAERQYHKESMCQCKCKDAFTESKLNCVEPFRYDSNTCRCKCAYQHRHCPVAKQRWDSKNCKCTCDKGIHCPKGQTINENSCECEAISMSVDKT